MLKVFHSLFIRCQEAYEIKVKSTLLRKNSLLIRTVGQTSLQFKRSLRSIKEMYLQLQRVVCKPECQVENRNKRRTLEG